MGFTGTKGDLCSTWTSLTCNDGNSRTQLLACEAYREGVTNTEGSSGGWRHVGGPGVATKGNTGGSDLSPTPTRISVGLQFSFFLSRSTPSLWLYACLTVRIGEGIMSERWNNRGIRHTRLEMPRDKECSSPRGKTLLNLLTRHDHKAPPT